MPSYHNTQYWADRWGIKPASVSKVFTENPGASRKRRVGKSFEYAFAASVDKPRVNKPKAKAISRKAVRAEKVAPSAPKFSDAAEAAVNATAALIEKNHQLQNRLDRIQAILNERD